MKTSHVLSVSIVAFFAMAGVESSLPFDLVNDFFDAKSVRIVYLKPSTFQDALQLTKFLSERNKFYTNTLNSPADMTENKLRSSAQIGVYFDCSSEENRQFLKNVANPVSFGLRVTWLIDLGVNNESLPYLREIDLRFVNDVTVATTISDRQQEFQLYSAYTQQFPDETLQMLPAGNWTAKHGLVYRLPERKYSLEKSQFNAAILIPKNTYDEEFLYEELQDRTYLPSVDSANRFYFSVALHIADLYNFSIKVMKADDWGRRSASGAYSGMTGMLTNGTVDWIIGPTRAFPERLDTMFPLFPLQLFRFPFAFKQPKQTGTYRALVQQLQADTWVFVAIIATVACITLSTIQRFRNKVGERKSSETGDESLSFGAVLVVGALSQQVIQRNMLKGLMSDPSDVPRRIACSFILFFSFMVATYYNAATMNALLSPSPPSIRNLEQLVASDIPLALDNVPYFTLPAPRTDLLDVDVIAKVNRSNLGFLNLEKGLELVLKKGAFCAEDFTLYKGIHTHFSDEQKCDLSIIDATSPIPAMYWTHKNSTYKEIMSQGTLRTKEHGLIDRQLKYWYPPKPECIVNQQWLWVGMEAVSIALGIYSVGLLSSIVLFNAEMMTAYLRQKRNTKQPEPSAQKNVK